MVLIGEIKYAYMSYSKVCPESRSFGNGYCMMVVHSFDGEGDRDTGQSRRAAGDLRYTGRADGNPVVRGPAARRHERHPDGGRAERLDMGVVYRPR